MPYPTIATVIPAEGGPGPLDAAIACAHAWKSRLDLVCVAEPRPSADLMLPDLTAAPMVLTEPDWEAMTAECQRARHRLSAEGIEWTSDGGADSFPDTSRAIVSRLRFADLAVLSRPYGPHASLLAETVFEALLLRSGLPLLVMPDRPAAPPYGKVLAAWDGSEHALAALRAALPLLKAAQQVEIVSVDPGAEIDPRGPAQMLEHHGVAVRVETLSRHGRSIADALLTKVAESGSDLIVMGGYGHTRLREALVGGVTRDLLTRAEIPLFLAH